MYKNIKIKKIKFTLGLILLITLNFTFIPSILTPNTKSNTEFNEIRSSGVYEDILIDDLPSSLTNWSWAQTQPWFGGGSGTSGSPYIIEDHIFEYSTGSGLCFGIQNSRKYFIINNCTFRNSALGSVAFLLSNVTNGQILNSSIYNSVSDGLMMGDTNGILISNNEIYDNAWSGIFMWGTSENNIITGNYFDNNGWFGTEINSNNNLFYNNYYKNPNIGHASDAGSNDWNNSVVGNYWDDYMGWDMNLDGIGDTPYDVPPPGGSQDYLPIWNIQTPIAIDDLPGSPINWAWAVSQAWCSGSGTSGAPYVIENLIIDGEGIDNCIFIQNSNKHFIIQNCRLYNSGTVMFASGILFVNVTNSQLIGNNASNNEFMGITLMNCNDTTISGNTVNNNAFGTLHIGCERNTISGNTFNNNTMNGIYLGDSHNNEILGNTIMNNFINGTTLMDCHDNTISGNTIKNNNIGISLDSSNLNTITENTATGNTFSNFYLLSDSNNNTLYKNIADKVSMYGIYLDDSHYNDIIDCEVYNSSDTGIWLTSSNGNNISQNIANYNLWGLFAEYSDDNTFSNNIFNNNTQLGMAVENSINNKILKNTANFNMIMWGGIMVSSSINTLVQDNNVIGNNLRGIGFIFNSNNNNATGNVIKENTVGLLIESGSDNNLFYENFFLQNGMHAIDDGLNNDWNSTSIGNYWDNWTTPDTDPPFGIVDDPYTYIGGIAGSIDYLPIADDTAPIVMINTPSNDDLFGIDAPNFDVTITDDFLFEKWYTMDEGLHNYTFTGFTDAIDQSAWDAMPDGTIILTFYASDKSGNIGSDQVNLEKDTHEPIIIITVPITNQSVGANAPNFIVQITDDNLDSMWYSINGGLTNFTFISNGTIDQKAWEALAEGSVTITFYANDTVGNVGSETVDVVKALTPRGDNFIVIIVVISVVSGGIVATIAIVVVLRKRKAGEEV